MSDVRIVMLGRLSDRSRQEWSRCIPDLDVIELAHAAPSALRLMSPWRGVACRSVGLKNPGMVGLYATPRSKPWDFLVRRLGDTPLVVTSEREASDWIAAGDRARPVVWGGEFGSSLSKPWGL